MYAKGFIKVAAASPMLHTGDVSYNVKEIIACLKEINKKNVDISVFPEMCICGYSVADLVFQDYLYQECLKGIDYLLKNNPYDGVVIVCSFFKIRDSILNCACVIQKDKILGIVPKSYLPHTNEFYETRWYVSGLEFTDVKEIYVNSKMIPFGKLLFSNADRQVQFGVEICEDMWAPMPPHEELYANGAIVVFNASASPEVIGKDEKRKMMVESASYRCNGAYVYTSNNPSESSSEVLFSNHKIMMENGNLVAESHSIDINKDTILYGDFDISKLHYLRKTNGWVKNILHQNLNYDYQIILYDLKEADDFIFEKDLDKLPFVPKDEADYKNIIDTQATSVKKRLDYIGIKKVVIGVSGGLDSTLALLSLCHMCDKYKLDRSSIIALTLPSSNNSSRTKDNAVNMMKKLGLNYQEINISGAVSDQLSTIKHDKKDVTYENVQARYRTFTLMNIANKEGAIVIGTSDMSEVALGWSTFNGDQMAMYGINSGLPKTVVKETVRYYKKVYPFLSDILDSIIDTPISPELAGGNQLTEEIIGKYEINDFILHRFLSCGDSNERIVYLLEKVLKLSKKDSADYVNNFYKRFYHQQYKRLTMPEGVKILDLSLSPRTQTRLNGDIYEIPIEK